MNGGIRRISLRCSRRSRGRSNATVKFHHSFVAVVGSATVLFGCALDMAPRYASVPSTKQATDASQNFQWRQIPDLSDQSGRWLFSAASAGSHFLPQRSVLVVIRADATLVEAALRKFFPLDEAYSSCGNFELGWDLHEALSLAGQSVSAKARTCRLTTPYASATPMIKAQSHTQFEFFDFSSVFSEPATFVYVQRGISYTQLGLVHGFVHTMSQDFVYENDLREVLRIGRSVSATEPLVVAHPTGCISAKRYYDIDVQFVRSRLAGSRFDLAECNVSELKLDASTR